MCNPIYYLLNPMELLSIFSGDTFWFTWVLLPVLIFLSRIADVTIGTMRLIFLSKGYKLIAPALGFFEVIIWLAAVGQIMQHLNNVFCYIAYGLGFAAGNYLGMRVEEKLSIGTVMVRIFPRKDTSELIQRLKEEGYGITSIDAHGAKGAVKVIMTIVQRKLVHEVIQIIHQYNPNAFYTIEDVKTVHEGFFRKGKGQVFQGGLFKIRKGK